MHHTLLFWKVFQIYQHREVVARLGLDDIRSILSLQHCLRAILDQFLEALDVQRH
jgi:hypothetical protein